MNSVLCKKCGQFKTGWKDHVCPPVFVVMEIDAVEDDEEIGGEQFIALLKVYGAEKHHAYSMEFAAERYAQKQALESDEDRWRLVVVALDDIEETEDEYTQIWHNYQVFDVEPEFTVEYNVRQVV